MMPTFALMIEDWGCFRPLILRMEVKTYRLHVTMAETGLPGNPKNNFLRSQYVSVANVVGFLKVQLGIYYCVCVCLCDCLCVCLCVCYSFLHIIRR